MKQSLSSSAEVLVLILSLVIKGYFLFFSLFQICISRIFGVIAQNNNMEVEHH